METSNLDKLTDVGNWLFLENQGAFSDADVNIPAARAELSALIAENERLAFDKFDKIVLRQAVADYMYSEGCSCCQNIDAHREHKKKLAELLDVPPYEDDSGYDFYRFRSEL